MKLKKILCVVLVALLATTLSVPLVQKSLGGADTLTVNVSIPPEHAGHTPLQDPGFWVNYGTPDTPSWYYFDWGSTVSPSWLNVYDIKVPVAIRDSMASGSNGHVHTFRFSNWTDGVTVLDGPKGEPAHDGLPPTLRFKLDPEGTATAEYGRAGPKTDVLRAKVIKNPDAQLIAMQVEEGVVLTDLIRTGDIEKLDIDGFTMTASNLNSSSLHIGYIGINLRPNRDYLTPPYQSNPDAAPFLSDVNFRHALFHYYNQEEIVSSIYGYIVTPVQSLVPPAQGGWVNPEVPLHPYNPGDKEGTTAYDPGTGENEDAASILRYGGYVYDSGINNWKRVSDNTPVPSMQLWTPTYEVAPTSAEHGARWVQELNDNGLTAISHMPREFSPYIDDVEIGDFDIYMVFQSIGRFPDNLYYMCHSSQDVLNIPGALNAPGCNEPELDAAVETIETSLNHTEKLQAAYKAQNILYNESYPDSAFSYMPLYSRIYFDAFNPDLRGIENPPAGYGSNNPWTFLNIHWEPGTERLMPDGRTIIEWISGEEPELLNPTSASTVYAWLIMDRIVDSLISITAFGKPPNMYPTYMNMPWLATDWDRVEDPDGVPGAMNITFYLRTDVFWQDGNPYTAEDAKFNWLFLRNNQIPRYTSMTKFIVDVDVIDDYSLTVILNTTSQFLVYDFAATAALLPPPVWSRLDGKPLAEILEYDPSTNTTAPTGAGPWFGDVTMGPTTQLYGTGAFVFDYYDPFSLVAEVHQNPHYLQFTDNVREQRVEIFHKMGDLASMFGPGLYDGEINVFDLGWLGSSYGQFSWMPGYIPEADLNEDGVIDARDLAMVTWHWGYLRDVYGDLVSVMRARFGTI